MQATAATVAARRVVVLPRRSATSRVHVAASAANQSTTTTTPSVGIIGAGSVGTAIASSLIHHQAARTLLIYDQHQDVCRGTVLDLEDEAFSVGTTVRSTSALSELRGCRINVVTAGGKQNPGESRLSLIERNVAVLRSVIGQLLPLQDPRGILLIVTNPVDVLTQLVQDWCVDVADMPRSRVIGSGTYLDSQRVRVALAQRLGVSSRSIHAYVLGEHGDSQVFPRSLAHVAGCPLSSYPDCTPEMLADVEASGRRKAYDIIRWKGATSHGIGECVAHLCDSILMDKREAFPVSVYQPEYDACLGWPAVLGAEGVARLIPLHLTDDERESMAASARSLRAAMLSVF